MVDAIVAQLGLALENAQLLEETQRNAFFEQTAGEVAARIRLEVEIESVLQRALGELGRALDVEWGSARLALEELDSDEDVTVTSASRQERRSPVSQAVDVLDASGEHA
jgi:GAF domain-containing protein